MVHTVGRPAGSETSLKQKFHAGLAERDAADVLDIRLRQRLIRAGVEKSWSDWVEV
jgi:hypothetical protein